MNSPHPNQSSVGRSLPIIVMAVVLTLAASHLFGAEATSLPERDGVVEAQALLDADERGQALDVLEDWLDKHPTDDQARFLHARSLGWDGRYAESLSEYERLLNYQPNNVDYLLGKSQTLIWTGRYADAFPVLARAREIAPDYEELWRLELNALIASDEPGSQKRLSAFVDKAQQRFPTAEWTNYVPPSRAKIESGFSYDHLSDGLNSWQELYVAAEYRLADRKVIYGRARAAERFDQSDQELMTGFSMPFDDNWSMVFEGSVAPGATVLPQWSLFGQVQRTLPHGFGLNAGWRHARYEESDLNLMTVMGEYWLDNYRASYTLYGASINGGELLFSHSLRLDRYYGERGRISLIAATGEEVESVGNNFFILNEVQTLALTGQHWFGERWAVSWELGQAWGDLYNKQRFLAGLTRQF